MIASFRMDPTAVRTFTIDWTKWPFPSGTRIASATWTIPTAFVLIAESVIGFKTNVKVRLRSTNSAPNDYEFACHMVSTDGSNPPAQDSRRIGVKVCPR